MPHKNQQIQWVPTRRWMPIGQYRTLALPIKPIPLPVKYATLYKNIPSRVFQANTII